LEIIIDLPIGFPINNIISLWIQNPRKKQLKNPAHRHPNPDRLPQPKQNKTAITNILPPSGYN